MAHSWQHTLTKSEKKGIAGTLACSFSQIRDGSSKSLWSIKTFSTVTHDLLQMENDDFEAFLPLLTRSEKVSAEPFICLIPKEKQEGLVKLLLWLFVAPNGYDARIRTLLRYIAKELTISWHIITEEEKELGMKLFTELASIEGNRGGEKRNIWDWKRNAKIGLAAATGATLLAVTGGLAAPAIAAGFTSLGGAGVAVGTAFASVSGVAATTAMFGAAGAGLAGYKADRRTLGISLFEFNLVSSGSGMNLTICVSGWLSKEDTDETGTDFLRPWGSEREFLCAFYRKYNPSKVNEVDAVLKRYRGREDELYAQLRKIYQVTSKELVEFNDDRSELSPADLRAWRWRDKMSGDQYCLFWDDEVLERFAVALTSFVANKAFDYASSEVVKQTVLASLYAAVALPTALVKAANMIDSEWTMALERADAAGKLLAQVLLAREHGIRPVTLIGYSMGARLIYSCLKAIAEAEDDTGCGIIENAVLLGSPVGLKTKEWANMSRIVSGRLINGYSTNDWILSLMYRYQGMSISVCGTSIIETPEVENIDLSDIINGHLEYRNKIGDILDFIKLEY